MTIRISGRCIGETVQVERHCCCFQSSRADSERSILFLCFMNVKESWIV